jgi:aspartate-semialdehyde dehydrogenase
MNKIRTAILGAAGVLGQRFVERLENHYTFEITALTDMMVGKRYEEATKWRLGMRKQDQARPKGRSSNSKD